MNRGLVRWARRAAHTRDRENDAKDKVGEPEGRCRRRVEYNSGKAVNFKKRCKVAGWVTGFQRPRTDTSSLSTIGLTKSGN